MFANWRFHPLAWLVSAFIATTPLPLLAEERVALVVGNAAYENAPALANPANDANLIADTLETLDFEVVRVVDADRRELGKSIQRFGARLRQAGTDAVGLFFYAGHGVQSAGENFLIPIGARIETESDLELEALTMASVLGQMRDAGNATNIVILDACRDNPYRSNVRTGTRGLARATAEGGTLIAFSAAPGQVAQDGRGANSPYSAALSKAMKEPGESIERVFKRVLVEVEDATLGEQVPWVQSSLRGDFFFEEGEPAPAAPPVVSVETRETPDPPDTTLEIPYWNAVRDSDDPVELEAFLASFPDGVFAPAARKRLEALLTPEPEPEPEPEPPAPAEAPERSDRDLTVAIQTRLNDLGCNAGPADGIWGGRSRAALRRFADTAGDGSGDLQPSEALLARLEAGDAPACPVAQAVSRTDTQDDPAAAPASSLDGRWSYAMQCRASSGNGSLDITGGGGTWTGRFLSGPIISVSKSGGSATLTVRYVDLLGRTIVETWSVQFSGNSMRGSVSGGYQDGCTITASK